MKINLTSLKIAVIGLGYVGLPLANLLKRLKNSTDNLIVIKILRLL